MQRDNTVFILGYIPNSPTQAEQPNLALKLALLGGPLLSKLLCNLVQNYFMQQQEERAKLTLRRYLLLSALQSLKEPRE